MAVPYSGKLAEALAQVKAATLVMPVSSDRTHTVEMGETLRHGLANSRVTWAPLDSVRGHVAVFRPPGTPEGDFVAGRTQDFLKSLR